MKMNKNYLKCAVIGAGVYFLASLGLNKISQYPYLEADARKNNFLTQTNRDSSQKTNSLAEWVVEDARTTSIPSIYREQLYNPPSLGFDPTNKVPEGINANNLESLLVKGANKANRALRFNRTKEGLPREIGSADMHYAVKGNKTDIQFNAGINKDWKQCLSIENGLLDQFSDMTWRPVRFRSNRYCDENLNPTLLDMQFARENNPAIGPVQAVEALKESLVLMGANKTYLDSLKVFTFQEKVTSDEPTPRIHVMLYSGEDRRKYDVRAEFINCIPPNGGFGYLQVNPRTIPLRVLDGN